MSRMAVQTGLTAGLIILLVLSSVAVVYVTHENRRLVGALQNMLSYQQQLQVEWGQLMLEQSTWAAHGRIESLATKKLHMELPSAQDVVIVK